MRTRIRQRVGLVFVICASAMSVSLLLDSMSSTEPLTMEVFGAPIVGKAIQVDTKKTSYLDNAGTQHLESTKTISKSEVLKKTIRWTNFDNEDAYLLAKIAMAEAEGEDTIGKALVIRVVLNRVQDDSFPDYIADVIHEQNQFSPVHNGRWDSVEPDEDCWKAIEMIDHGWDDSQGALYFESASASTWHRDNLEFLFQHGNHLFYAEKEE